MKSQKLRRSSCRSLAAVAACMVALVACSRTTESDAQPTVASASATVSAVPPPSAATTATTVAIDAPPPACARSCSKPEDCPNIPCPCEDGTIVNMTLCLNSCCGPADEACSSACRPHDGPRGTWNTARDGKKTGAACAADAVCASRLCVRGFCSKKCASFGECPPFWKCEPGASGFDRFCRKGD